MPIIIGTEGQNKAAEWVGYFLPAPLGVIESLTNSSDLSEQFIKGRNSFMYLVMRIEGQ